DVDLDALSGELLGQLEDVDVHTARIAGPGLVERRGVQADHRQTPDRLHSCASSAVDLSDIATTPVPDAFPEHPEAPLLRVVRRVVVGLRDRRQPAGLPGRGALGRAARRPYLRMRNARAAYGPAPLAFTGRTTTV